MRRFFSPDGAASTTATTETPAATTTTAAATTTEEGKTATSQTASSTETPAKKAPAKYELTVPDDAKRFVGPKQLAAIETIARANDWTNDEAQTELAERIAIHQAEIAEQVTAWETTLKADKDYGGDKLPETQRLANTVIDRVRPAGHARRDSFLAFLGNSGGGVNIEVASFLADLGKLMGEDGSTGGRSTGGSSAKDDGASFYTHPTSRAIADGSKR